MDRAARNRGKTPEGQLDEGDMQGLLGYQLAQATVVATQAFSRVAGEPFELRPVEFTILQLIAGNPDASISRLAKALAITGPAVATWAERLASRGLIERERGIDDRRIRHLRITPQGSRLVAQALAGLLSTEQALLDHLSAGERTMLLELLQKVAASRRSGR